MSGYERIERISGFCLILGTAASCASSTREITIWQDPNIRWATSVPGYTAAELFQQTHASDAAKNSGGEYSSVDDACAAFAGEKWGSVGTSLINVHRKLYKKEQVDEKGWADITTPNDAIQFSVVRSSTSAGGSAGYTEIPMTAAELKAAYSSEGTDLIVALLASEVSVSGDAMRCIRSNACSKGERGVKLKYVSKVYYGGLIRMKLSKETFGFSGALDAASYGKATLALNLSSFSLEGAILGSFNAPAGLKEKYDVPNILEDLGQSKFIRLQSQLTGLASTYTGIAYRIDEIDCDRL